MVVIHQNSVGSLDRDVAQEPAAGVLQCFCRERIDAPAHRSQTKIVAVCDDRGEQ
jgi:hypothetical protein